MHGSRPFTGGISFKKTSILIENTQIGNKTLPKSIAVPIFAGYVGKGSSLYPCPDVNSRCDHPSKNRKNQKYILIVSPACGRVR
jgi:hypothetical protein